MRLWMGAMTVLGFAVAIVNVSMGPAGPFHPSHRPEETARIARQLVDPLLFALRLNVRLNQITIDTTASEGLSRPAS
jgi:hypothetical protein